MQWSVYHIWIRHLIFLPLSYLQKLACAVHKYNGYKSLSISLKHINKKISEYMNWTNWNLIIGSKISWIWMVTYCHHSLTIIFPLAVNILTSTSTYRQSIVACDTRITSPTSHPRLTRALPSVKFTGRVEAPKYMTATRLDTFQGKCSQCEHPHLTLVFIVCAQSAIKILNLKSD